MRRIKLNEVYVTIIELVLKNIYHLFIKQYFDSQTKNARMLIETDFETNGRIIEKRMS